MPRIKKQIDEEEFEESEDDEEEFDEDDEDEEELEVPIKRKVPIKKRNITEEEPKRRFGIVAPQTLKIVDTETQELVGEGDFAVVQALTDILERLERIETQIGAMAS